MSNEANTPAARIIVYDTALDQRQGYLPHCLENVLPYANDGANPKIAKLITNYDQDRREDIKEGGPHHAALLARLQTIATNLQCNLLFWSSEGGQCRKPDVVRAEVQKVLPNNTFPTVVLLTGCNTKQFAFVYNKGEKQIKFGENKASQQPLFLGFDHQIHRLKEDIFICEHPMERFPMLTCKGKSISKETAITNGLTNSQGNILDAARRSEDDKVKCCIDRVEGFPYYFVEEFKGERNCGKINWTKLQGRIANILAKKDARNTITAEDSSIRWDEDSDKCKPVNGNANPCGIVNEFPNKQWNAQDAKFSENIKLWGTLIANLKDDKGNYGTSGSRFYSILNRLSAEKQKELVNTKDKNEHSILYTVLFDPSLSMNGPAKKRIVVKLLEIGSPISEVYNSANVKFERSIPELFFEEYKNLIDAKDLFRFHIDLNDDASFQKKLDFIKITNGQQMTPSQKDVTAVIKDIKNNFVIYVQDLLKEIYDKSKNKDKKKDLFQRFQKKYTLDFVGFKDIRGKDAIIASYDTAVKILNLLKSEENGKSIRDFMIESMEALQTREPKNILPLPENATGGHRMTRKRQTTNRNATAKKRRLVKRK